MKKIIPEYEFTSEQLHTVRELAFKSGLLESTVRALWTRGIDDIDKIRKFMHPSEDNFLSPFLMKGMKELVEILKTARDEDMRVAVFGDYDADGVCASTILYYALRDFGIDPYVYIPERAEGYGLSVAAIDQIFDEFCPDIFITVDCGISNHDEVEYIKECGGLPIVTDHHELPLVLPDCICVNPKLKDDYPYDNLCGAGVAFKLACALLGKDAYQYLDFAALATIADSVPLTGENRDIVHEGLKRVIHQPRRSFSALMGKNSYDITAQTLAFNIAPKINAAGRMGDAKLALRLFLCESAKEVDDCAAKLCAYNTERQKCCDDLYNDAKRQLREKGAYGKVIMLAGENWNTGFVGIVAARLAEEYNRPALLFVQTGDSMKGSARSIDSINIFEALRACSHLISEFGGHSQAAGVNVSAENFALLEDALNEYIQQYYTRDVFELCVPINGEITDRVSLRFANELKMLEPFGVGNRKPLFALDAKSCVVYPMKARSVHLSIRNPYLDLVYFNGIKKQSLIASDVEKKFIVELNVSTFRGRDSIKGFVKDIIYDGASGEQIACEIFTGALDRICRDDVAVIRKEASLEAVRAEIAAYRKQYDYGLCLVINDRRNLKLYKAEIEGLCVDLFVPSLRDLSNTVVISPSYDTDLSGYRKIVYLDTPADYNIACLEGREVCVCKDVCGYQDILELQSDRMELLKIFATLRANGGKITGEDVLSAVKSSEGMGIEENQLVYALTVFCQLGLVAFENGRLIVFRGIKADLSASLLYNKIRAVQDGNVGSF